MFTWFERNTTLVVPMLLTDEDNTPIVPDVSSVFLTVKDSQGVKLLNSVPVMDISGSYVNLEIPEEINTTTINGDVRIVEVIFRENGKLRVRKLSYYLSEFLPITVQAEDIKDLLGLQDFEVNLHIISPYMAYYDLVEKVSGFSECLKAITTNNKANQVIAIHTALLFLTSGKFSYLSSWKSESHSYSRFTSASLSDLITSLESRKEEILSQLFPDLYATTRTYFLVTTPTDKVTGS